MTRPLKSALALTLAVSGLSLAHSPAQAFRMSPLSGRIVWPRPHDTLSLAKRAGLTPARHEYFTYHVHAHLDIFLNGKPVQIPAAIGIDTRDPGVKKLKAPDGSTAWGHIQLCANDCISPLHTHDDTGVIHTESPTPHSYHLAQFFSEWSVKLSSKCVGQFCAPKHKITVFLNGKRYKADPAKIVLANHLEIAIVIGTPPGTVPSSYDFSGL